MSGRRTGRPRLWLVDEFGHGGIGRYAVDVAGLVGDLDTRGTRDALDTVVATSALGPVPGLTGRSVEWFPRPGENALGKGLGGVVGLGRAVRTVRRGDVAWLPLGIRPAFELALAGVLRARGARVVVTVHNRGPHGRGASPTVVRAARLAEAVVVHTEGLERWAREAGLAAVRLPFPPPRVAGTPGAAGRDTTRAATREALGVPPGAVVVALLGYLYAYKGVDLLVEAFVEARRRSPALPVHLLLAGRPPAGPEGAGVREALAGVEGRADVTLRPGWLEEAELSALLDAADAVALPYREIDNSGSGALARSRGVPAVASDLPTLREVFGAAALYVPPGDVAALAEALRALPERLPDLAASAATSPVVDLAGAFRGFVSGLVPAAR